MLSLFTIIRRNLRKVGLKRREVTLTFDDGPNCEDDVTPDLLSVLHKHSVKACFCVVGKQVRKHPDVVRRMHRSGHLLVNHTESHQHPFGQSLDSLAEDVLECDRTIAEALKDSTYRSEFFRVPFGIVTMAVRRVCRKLNLKPLLVTHYGWDTRFGPHNFTPVVDSVISNAKKRQGGMFVLHDGSIYPPDVPEPDWSRSPENRVWIPEAVDRIITELKAEGLRFVLPAGSSASVGRKSESAAA